MICGHNNHFTRTIASFVYSLTSGATQKLTGCLWVFQVSYTSNYINSIRRLSDTPSEYYGFIFKSILPFKIYILNSFPPNFTSDEDWRSFITLVTDLISTSNLLQIISGYSSLIAEGKFFTKYSSQASICPTLVQILWTRSFSAFFAEPTFALWVLPPRMSEARTATF
jgi:hypothetical protein